MCGIAGITYSPKNHFNETEIFRSLLEENTERGKHATGIVYGNKDNIHVYRGFAKGNNVAEFVWPNCSDSIMLGHCRFATIGDKEDIQNVHPFETKNIIGVHNGSIFNYKLLIKYFGLSVKSECDSEVVFQLIDGFGISSLKFVVGTYMLAFIYKDKPDELCIVTNGSKPLTVLKTKNYLAFGSFAKETIKRFPGEVGLKILSPVAGHFYKIKEGNLIWDEKLDVPTLTEEEGELRYKLEYKNKYIQFFNDVPENTLLLPAPKKEIKNVISNATGGYYHNNYSFKENILGEELITFLGDNFRFLHDETIQKQIQIPLPILLQRITESQAPAITRRCISFENSKVFLNLYCLEIFMLCSIFSNLGVVLVEKDDSSYFSLSRLLGKDSALVLAKMLCRVDNKYFDEVLEHIKLNLVSTGILDPEIFVASSYTHSANKETETETILKDSGYYLNVYNMQKQLGKDFVTDREFKDFVSKEKIEYSFDKSLLLNRALLFGLAGMLELKREEEDKEDSGCETRILKNTARMGKLMFNHKATLERYILKIKDPREIIMNGIIQDVDVLSAISTGFLHIILNKHLVNIPSGNDLVHSMDTRVVENSDSLESKFACSVVNTIRKLNELFSTYTD